MKKKQIKVLQGFLKVIKCAIETYDKVKENKLKAAKNQSRKVTTYTLTMQWWQYLEKGDNISLYMGCTRKTQDYNS